jgi:NAD(P)-dependent dehydrogenase (short-subunit alcohol dehydrogenase family)
MYAAQVDVSKEDQVEALMQAAVSFGGGRLDHLVNNAARCVCVSVLHEYVCVCNVRMCVWWVHVWVHAFVDVIVRRCGAVSRTPGPMGRGGRDRSHNHHNDSHKA